MSLSPQELEQFQSDGYVVKAGIFSASDLVPLRQAMDRIVDEEAERLQREGVLENSFPDLGFEHRLGAIMSTSHAAGMAIYRAIMGKKGGGGYTGPELFNMVVHPPLLSCIESIVGPDIVASSVYRIRPKMPQFAIGEVPWHQDSAYMNAHCDTHMIVTCWIPLVDSTLANGCLWVQPGVHRGELRSHYTEDTSHYLVIPDKAMQGPDPLPMEMKAGDVLFLTNKTPHCSRENNTDIVRWSIDLRYQALDVPTNAEQDPEEYDPDLAPDEMACYPPEADFIVRCREHPEREIRTPEAFHELRQRYEEAAYIKYPQRGWTRIEELSTAQ